MATFSVNGSANKANTMVADRVDRPNYGAGLNAAEARVTGLENAISKASEGFIFFHYDIPSAFQSSTPGNVHSTIVEMLPVEIRHYFFEPVALFRRYGGYLSDSVGYLLKSAMESTTVQTLFYYWELFGNGADLPRDLHFPIVKGVNGVKSHTMPQGPENTAAIVAILQERLREWLTNLHTSLITNIINADERLQKRLAELGPEATEKEQIDTFRKRENAVRGHLRNCDENLKIAVEAAQRYDDSEKTADLLAGLRAVLRAEIDAFNAGQESERMKLDLPD